MGRRKSAQASQTLQVKADLGVDPMPHCAVVIMPCAIVLAIFGNAFVPHQVPLCFLGPVAGLVVVGFLEVVCHCGFSPSGNDACAGCSASGSANSGGLLRLALVL